MSTEVTYLGGDPIVEGGGVGLLPALCLRRIAWVLFTLVMDSCLFPSSGPRAGQWYQLLQISCFDYNNNANLTAAKANIKSG